MIPNLLRAHSELFLQTNDLFSTQFLRFDPSHPINQHVHSSSYRKVVDSSDRRTLPTLLVLTFTLDTRKPAFGYFMRIVLLETPIFDKPALAFAINNNRANLRASEIFANAMKFHGFKNEGRAAKAAQPLRHTS